MHVRRGSVTLERIGARVPVGLAKVLLPALTFCGVKRRIRTL